MAIRAFTSALERFANTLTENFSVMLSAQPEDQLKAPMVELLRAVGAALGMRVVARTEVQLWDGEGRPDIGVTVAKLLAGHIELKAPGTGARPQFFTDHNKRQWDKFKSLPNLDLL